jgi:penicillin-binding protein 2A
VSLAIPFDRISKTFSDALAAAEPRSSFPYQIARSLMCNRHESPARYDLDVVRLSWQIRRHFSSEQLFTIYTNRAYFGSGATGVENASQHFFQRDTYDLRPEQAALLAGLIRGPSIFSPFEHPERALQRRNAILQKMAAQGKLGAAELAAAMAAPLSIGSQDDAGTARH